MKKGGNPTPLTVGNLFEPVSRGLWKERASAKILSTNSYFGTTQETRGTYPAMNRSQEISLIGVEVCSQIGRKKNMRQKTNE